MTMLTCTSSFHFMHPMGKKDGRRGQNVCEIDSIMCPKAENNSTNSDIQ